MSLMFDVNLLGASSRQSIPVHARLAGDAQDWVEPIRHHAVLGRERGDMVSSMVFR